MIKVKKFIGAIAFLDSEKEDRRTAVMTFEIMTDWFQSVLEFHRQAVKLGDFDGTEILVNVYEYSGTHKPFEGVHPYMFDSQDLIHSESIRNPYHV